ncbi:MAG: glycosyl hydrolase [Litorilinea sp.]
MATACTVAPIQDVESPQPAVDFLVPTPNATSTPATVPVAIRATDAQAVEASPPPILAEPYTLRWRAGVGIPDGAHPRDLQWTTPRPGWYLNWHFGTLLNAPPLDDQRTPGHPDYLDVTFSSPDDTETGMAYVPMVYDLTVATDTLKSVVRSLPGRVWLIGNEPDVRWQGNLTPEAYAAGYHRIYHIIKDIDPTAQIAIGGISQVTPLRLAYLDRVLQFYAATYGEPMPVDVWNIHTFILQEKRDEWGVDIPPGFEATHTGQLWTIEDHDSLEIIRTQIVTMRAWMRAQGEQDKPLWITEYGILMPESYGFPPAQVARFMTATFDLFQELRDPDLGWAQDEHRLVQRWVWFSAGYDPYPTGNLFDDAGAPTLLMETYADYLAAPTP